MLWNWRCKKISKLWKRDRRYQWEIFWWEFREFWWFWRGGRGFIGSFKIFWEFSKLIISSFYFFFGWYTSIKTQLSSIIPHRSKTNKAKRSKSAAQIQISNFSLGKQSITFSCTSYNYKVTKYFSFFNNIQCS